VYISQKELSSVVNVVDLIRDCDASKQSRQRLTRHLMRLCGADYGASFSWDNTQGCYVDAAFENMAADNIERYNQYFQYNNPLSKKVSHYRRAVAVSEVMPHKTLAKTEFFNDFLQRDGLTYGINLFVHSGNQQIFDFRIWRSKKRQDFQAKHLQLLDCLIPSLQQMSKNRARRTNRVNVGLTPRENEVVDSISAGMCDKQIAECLNISVTTLRTHLRKIYQKAKVHSRTELISKLN
jgi:DNA-binding CsgD family transcriptional regulator